jgi:hypothetical protein
MDPNAVATLLDVLAEAVRTGIGPSTADLGAELAKMVDVTRKWAAEHEIPPECIPGAPGPDVTNARAAEFLTDLAKVVRYLGPHATPLDKMVEVVALLKVRHAPAAMELAELDYALKQLFSNLTVLEETVGAVSAELAVSADVSSERFSAIHDTVDHAHENLQQIVAAMREVCRGVEAWGLVENDEAAPPSTTRLS